jgi:bifunctional non-homologous end joining protein LigD
MIEVSNADRVVFPEIGRTKGEVVRYYERIAPRALVHVEGRMLSIKRFPKGLAGPGFFQKNVPAHYPASIERYAVPRSHEASKKHRDEAARAQDVTTYPVLREAEHLPYVANQGAIELHVGAMLVPSPCPVRLIVDLDPPKGALDLVRRAARIVREALGELSVPSTPVATGSKGYHIVAVLEPTVDAPTLALAAQKLAAMLAAKHEADLTTTFRIAERGGRVFLDWLRNNPGATVVAPFSLRATPRATVATPIEWEELDAIAPDTFTMDDVERLLERKDALAALAPVDPAPFVRQVDEAFDKSGLVLERFDRFRA